MRALWLVGLLAASGCHKDRTEVIGPTTPASTAELDALWRLAPEGAKIGVVVSPRGVAMIERAAAAIQALLGAAPELASARDTLAQSLTRELGSPKLALAELGLTAAKGFAAFGVDRDDAVIVVPLADRDRFLARTHGRKDGDHDAIGSLRCKPIGERYICIEKAQRFDRLGRGGLDATLRTAGARGDLEIVSHGFPGAGSPTVAVVAQLERGAFVVRGTVSGVPREVTQWIGSPGSPRADPTAMAGFGVIDLAPYLGQLPPVPIAPKVTLPDLARTVSGPATFTNPAGTGDFDLRIPLSDPAPARALIEHCPQLLAAIGATLKNGVCHVPIPTSPLEIDGRVDGNQLRLGYHAPGKSVAIAASPLATELAGGTWSFAMFGRGSFLGVAGTPGAQDILQRLLAAYPEAADAFLRTLPWFSELGLGIRNDGDAIHFVLGVRTAWANPDAVVQRLLAISAEQIRSGKAGEIGRSIAKTAPDSPFAQDFKAGAGGMLAVTPLTIVPTVAVPAFMDYMKRSKKTEAALQLNKLARNAKRAYAETSEFPRGKAPLTPAAPCCSGPDHRCVTRPADWQRDVWKALDFEIDEPALFQYSYESDGRTFTAKAVGDLDCDGTTITYELRGTAENGNPATELIEPPPNSD